MSEWLKILVSALAGMMTGAALEPLKHQIRLRMVAGKAKRGIHSELARVYYFMNQGQSLPEKFSTTALSRMVFDTFDYFYTQERESFYLLERHHDIAGLYRELRLIQEEVRCGRVSGGQGARDFCSAIDLRLECRSLDKELFDREVNEYKKDLVPFQNANWCSSTPGRF